MELSDLPPEIFQKVIAAYVAKVGLRTACAHQTVCKTFKAYISEEVYGRQPTKAYKRKTSNDVLEKGLVKFLEFRAHTLCGAGSTLPNIIRRVVDRFRELDKDTSRYSRAEYVRDVSKAIAKHCTSARTLIVYPASKYAKTVAEDDNDIVILSLDILCGYRALVDLLLKQGVNSWEDSHLLGSSMTVAAKIGDIKLVQVMIDRSNTSSVYSKQQTDSMEKTTYQSLRAGHENVAIHLTKWQSLHAKLSRKACNTFFAWAREAGSSEFLAYLLDQGYEGVVETYYRRNYLSTWTKTPEKSFSVLLEKGLLNLSTTYKAATDRQGQPPQSVLAHAGAKWDGIDFVTEVLEAGANPNGLLKEGGGFEYPLL